LVRPLRCWSLPLAVFGGSVASTALGPCRCPHTILPPVLPVSPVGRAVLPPSRPSVAGCTSESLRLPALPHPLLARIRRKLSLRSSVSVLVRRLPRTAHHLPPPRPAFDLARCLLRRLRGGVSRRTSIPSGMLLQSTRAVSAPPQSAPPRALGAPHSTFPPDPVVRCRPYPRRAVTSADWRSPMSSAKRHGLVIAASPCRAFGVVAIWSANRFNRKFSLAVPSRGASHTVMFSARASYHANMFPSWA